MLNIQEKQVHLLTLRLRTHHHTHLQHGGTGINNPNPIAAPLVGNVAVQTNKRGGRWTAHSMHDRETAGRFHLSSCRETILPRDSFPLTVPERTDSVFPRKGPPGLEGNLAARGESRSLPDAAGPGGQGSPRGRGRDAPQPPCEDAHRELAAALLPAPGRPLDPAELP